MQATGVAQLNGKFQNLFVDGLKSFISHLKTKVKLRLKKNGTCSYLLQIFESILVIFFSEFLLCGNIHLYRGNVIPAV